METANYIKQAKALVAKGISVIPLINHSIKKPKIKWKELQSRFLTDEEIEEHFESCGGIAAATGAQSRLVCIDFDLDKQLPHQDFWRDFNDLIPKNLRKKFNINRTRSGGYHIWLRPVDFNFPSRKIAFRLLSIPELMEKYVEYIKENSGDEDFNPDAFQRVLLGNPRECVIETRFEGSYAVLVHPSYNHIYGKKIMDITLEEWIFLENALYSLDCGFKKKKLFVGEEGDYSLIQKFFDDVEAHEVVDLLTSTGLYESSGEDSYGNTLIKRKGSKNPYSGKVFKDNKIFTEFGMSNLFTDGQSSHNAIQIVQAVKNLTTDEVYKWLNESYYGKKES